MNIEKGIIKRIIGRIKGPIFAGIGGIAILIVIIVIIQIIGGQIAIADSGEGLCTMVDSPGRSAVVVDDGHRLGYLVPARGDGAGFPGDVELG